VIVWGNRVKPKSDAPRVPGVSVKIYNPNASNGGGGNEPVEPPEHPDCERLREREAALVRDINKRSRQVRQLNAELLANADLGPWSGVDTALNTADVGAELLDFAKAGPAGEMGTAIGAGADLGVGLADIADGRRVEGAIRVAAGTVGVGVSLSMVHEYVERQSLLPGEVRRGLTAQAARAGVVGGIASMYFAAGEGLYNRYWQARMRTSIHETMNTLNALNHAAMRNLRNVVQEQSAKGCQ
jgi:hypothetical protein